MLNRLFHQISYLSYYFFTVKDIELEVADYIEFDIDLESNRKTYLIEAVKYFIWRKSSLCLLLLFLVIDFSLNIVSYQYDIDNFPSNNSNSEIYDVQSWHNTSNYIIDLLHPHKTRDFLTFYTVISSLVLLMEIIFTSLALYYHRSWYPTTKWVRYSFWISILWIYVIYINPLLNYMLFKSSYDSNKSYQSQDPLYSYTYLFILGYLLKEVIPIICAIYDSLVWSSVNFKNLYPKNTLVGYVFRYANILFFVSVGHVFLIVNQLFNNYLVSLSILSVFLGILVPYYLGRNTITMVLDEEDEELKNLVNNYKFYQIFFYVMGFIFLVFYGITCQNPLKVGLYEVYGIDVLQFGIKFTGRMIFYKILSGDTLFYTILHLEKFKTIYQEDLKVETKKLRDVENQLYMKSYYPYSVN